MPCLHALNTCHQVQQQETKSKEMRIKWAIEAVSRLVGSTGYSPLQGLEVDLDADALHANLGNIVMRPKTTEGARVWLFLIAHEFGVQVQGARGLSGSASSRCVGGY